ncbi:MAG TPA: tetratricopeptide repeat protein [Ktedonobacteraceae bacterium]|nr:tetratricopeptide repeat protein [Ktedonobacteraceae bacterium]
MSKIKKRTSQIPVSLENTTQAQDLLDKYHEIAKNLHESTNQEQVEAALAEINNMPEGAQMALLKALSKEHHADAADVLIAVNELSPAKSVRKEARRSLIGLQGVRIYPQWSPPIDRVPAVQVTTPPLRFWKGMVTDSRNVGEVQLALGFEQEDNPSQVRVFVFLLEFYHDGVKDFFSRTGNKRTADNFFAEMETHLTDVETKDCSLAQARRLILEALDVNKRNGTQPHKDYRFNSSLVNQLILEAPGLEEAELEEKVEPEEEDEEENTIDLHGLDPSGVVVNFVEFWVNGDFELAYELLSANSTLREGLSKDEWIERREAWLEEADPGELIPNFIHEREPEESKIWLPGLVSARRSATRKEFEVGWSIELEETPLTYTLPEVPQPTAIYEETQRHWFWTSYTLVQEENEWRIQSMTDEAAIALTLPIEELQKRIEKHDKFLDEYFTKHKPKATDSDKTQQFLNVVVWRIMQTVYYTEALIKKLPLDYALYSDVLTRLQAVLQYEHSLIYLEPLARQFPDGPRLRELAAFQRQLSNKFFDEADDERGEHFQQLAEEALRKSLSLENSFEAHISLAEILIDEKEHLDEAEDHLLQAKAMVKDPADDSHIEMHLGEIAFEQKQYENALRHYQHVANYHSDFAESWASLAMVYRMLEQYDEAEANYKRAIELEPDDEDYYYTLSEMFAANEEPEKAIEVLEEGLINNPDSAIMHLFLAMRYIDTGDYRQAELFLEKAERLDPDVPMGQMMHQVIDLLKLEHAPGISRSIPKLSRPEKKKRGR